MLTAKLSSGEFPSATWDLFCLEVMVLSPPLAVPYDWLPDSRPQMATFLTCDLYSLWYNVSSRAPIEIRLKLDSCWDTYWLSSSPWPVQLPSCSLSWRHYLKKNHMDFNLYLRFSSWMSSPRQKYLCISYLSLPAFFRRGNLVYREYNLICQYLHNKRPRQLH